MADSSLTTRRSGNSYHDSWRDPLGLGTTLCEALEIRRDSTSYHLKAFISADAEYRNGIAKHHSVERRPLLENNNQMDSRTALRIATSDLLKQDIVMLVSILRDIRAVANTRLKRGSALLCIVTLLWGVCSNTRESLLSAPLENMRRTGSWKAPSTKKEHYTIPTTANQRGLKKVGAQELYGRAKEQFFLSAATMLHLERGLLMGMAAASLYALFGISTRLIASHCLQKAELIQRKLLADELDDEYRQNLVGWPWTWLYRFGDFW